MLDDDDRGDAAEQSVPVTMSDIFLAMVAVVVILLLSLAPAVRQPQLLSSPAPFEVWNVDLRVSGERPVVLLATWDGLRVASDIAPMVPLDSILDDERLAGELERIAASGMPLLLLVQPDGDEAAFLFAALASGLGIETVLQVRIDENCGFVADATLNRSCRERGIGR